MRLAHVILAAAIGIHPASASPLHKSLTQYSRAIWTQQQGLPQDTVRAISQTPDGYLWLGTDEGLARFDGYEFAIFTREHDGLPANSITGLAVAMDGSLWVGTPNGLARYDGRHFRNFTQKDGLPADSVQALLSDHAGLIWIVAGGSLSRFDGVRFTNFLAGRDLPMSRVRAIAEDRQGAIYAAGYSAVARFEHGKFQTVVGPKTVGADFPLGVRVDRFGTLFILGTRGLIARSAAGQIRRYGQAQGLPNSFGLTGAVELDRDGNVWVGTAAGVARFEHGQFNTRSEMAIGNGRGSVRCVFEDREGNIWLGTNNGLVRLRDGEFTVYGKAEGLPSDEPAAVHQDRLGRIWVGFLDGGLQLFSGQTAPRGMPRNGVFSIGETRDGELLVAGRDGLTRLSGGRWRTFVPPDPVGRKSVYNVLADSAGRIWLALPSGLGVLVGDRFHPVIQGGVQPDASVYALAEGHDGSIWAGSLKGLWQIQDNRKTLYTVADGLESNQIHALHVDSGGTLWVGSFGGGLSTLRNGKFSTWRTRDGLLSDNISNILDDGESLWLSSTRGICRISQRELRAFAERQVPILHPRNYGMVDGLRSAQGSPGISGGGDRHADGTLWFVTTGGVAVYDPRAAKPTTGAPPLHLVEMSADGRVLDWSRSPRIPPGSGRLQLRYSAIQLSAPEAIQYSYRLDGLDSDWIFAGPRREVNYDHLGHGHYRFRLRAELPAVPASEAVYGFEVLPHSYETTWFRLLLALLVAALGWMVYRLRVGQIRGRFAAVLEERARLAREIHDTLTQAFVGIASQLDVVEMRMPEAAMDARESLELARRMAQHSLTEARRSVMDLRTAALDHQDLGAALESGAAQWASGSGVEVAVDINGEAARVPEEVAHQVLRIAQEAVSNVLKHAEASRVVLKLRVENRGLDLEVEDNGCGFEPTDAFTSTNGHFGLIGMRERAEQLGGELDLASQPGQGTRLRVSVPLS